MRLFQTLEEAAREVKRDLAKSPVVQSSRVQQFEVGGEAREALGYSYSISEFPEGLMVFRDLGVQLGFWTEEEKHGLAAWLENERHIRLFWEPGAVNELNHPDLVKTIEGSEPSYVYTDRLRGAVEMMSETLWRSPDSRRAFWPIFYPEDSIRAPRATRVPCSIGYQLLVRYVNGKPHLHLIYLERSCDFDRFWITDLWLAREFQKQVYRMLKQRVSGERDDHPLHDIELGHVTHFVTSLHSFIDEEIY